MLAIPTGAGGATAAAGPGEPSVTSSSGCQGNPPVTETTGLTIFLGFLHTIKPSGEITEGKWTVCEVSKILNIFFVQTPNHKLYEKYLCHQMVMVLDYNFSSDYPIFL